MSFTIHRIYTKKSDEPNFPLIKKVYCPEANRIIIKQDVDGTITVKDFDFRNLAPIFSFTPDGGYSNILYSLAAKESNIEANFVFAVNDSEPVEFLEKESIEIGTQYPEYLYVASDETESVETGTFTVPDCLTFSDADKQKRAINAIKNVWRQQKRKIMAQTAERADLSENIVAKMGKLLRSADSALKNVFLDTSVDQLIVEALALKASDGPLDYDFDDMDEFIRQVHALTSAPQTPSLWVEQGDTPPSTVARVNLNSLINYGTGNVPSDYDPTDTSWLVSSE